MLKIFHVLLLLYVTCSLGHADKLPWGGYKNFTIQQNLYVFHKDLVNWRTAKERCAGAGAELWVPADGAEQRAVRGELDRVGEDYDLWTGINDLDNTGTYRTPDGQPLSLEPTRWGGSEPNSRGGLYRCVMLKRGGSSLVVYTCNDTNRYVCKFPATSPPAPTTAPAPPPHATTPPPHATTPPREHNQPCDKLPWGGNKIFTIQQHSYLFHKYSVTWQQAKERCAGVGAELWAPADAGEQRAVAGEVNRVDDYLYIWTGINDLDYTGTYRTPDGRPVSTDRNWWRAGEPYSLGGEHRCVLQQRYGSSLVVYRCNDTNSYVCKFPVASEPSALCGNLTEEGHGYEFTIEQNSYVFHHNKGGATWQQARARCAGAGAELWVPADKGEQRAVRGEVDRVTEYPTSVWTGINDLDNTGTYRSLQGRPLGNDQYVWEEGQPDAGGGTRRCVMMGNDSPLVVEDCDYTVPYVCKLPAAGGEGGDPTPAPTTTPLPPPPDS